MPMPSVLPRLPSTRGRRDPLLAHEASYFAASASTRSFSCMSTWLLDDGRKQTALLNRRSFPPNDFGSRPPRLTRLFEVFVVFGYVVRQVKILEIVVPVQRRIEWLRNNLYVG